MSEVSESRYLYIVYPKKPIKNLNENLPLIRVSKSLYLTKEEVLKCLDCGSVYRRFSNEGIQEKVNKYDVDRVHNDKFISKEDWKKISGASKDINNYVVNGVTQEQTIEEPKEEIKEEKVEHEVKEEVQPQVEEVVEEPAKAEEENITLVEDTTEDTSTIDQVEEVDNNDAVINETSDVEEIKEEVVTSGYIAPADEEPISLDSVTTTNVPEDAPYMVVEEGTTIIDEDENSSNKDNNNVVVNYGKKKKHH